MWVRNGGRTPLLVGVDSILWRLLVRNRKSVGLGVLNVGGILMVAGVDPFLALKIVRVGSTRLKRVLMNRRALRLRVILLLVRSLLDILGYVWRNRVRHWTAREGGREKEGDEEETATRAR